MNERGLLVDCLRCLNRTGVVYYLTGSMASNYWGVPRSTHDLDFVVQLPQAAVPGHHSGIQPCFLLQICAEKEDIARAVAISKR